MGNYALGVEYDGSSYSGYQRQAEARSIQAELESALSSIAAEAITVTAAGRTDRGVHATQQVVSFETAVERPDRAWVVGVNSMLPDTIRVSWVRKVSAGFSARFSALWRRYIYVYGQNADYQVFLRDFVSWSDSLLNVESMKQVLDLFLGERDFSCLRAASCSSRTPFRHVYHLDVIKTERFVIIDVAANAFLLHMVRNLAAVLHEVGINKLNRDDVITLIDSRDRNLAPPTAHASGLYLTAVGYESGFEIDGSIRVPAVLGEIQEQFRPVAVPRDHYRRTINP